MSGEHGPVIDISCCYSPTTPLEKRTAIHDELEAAGYPVCPDEEERLCPPRRVPPNVVISATVRRDLASPPGCPGSYATKQAVAQLDDTVAAIARRYDVTVWARQAPKRGLELQYDIQLGGLPDNL